MRYVKMQFNGPSFLMCRRSLGSIGLAFNIQLQGTIPVPSEPPQGIQALLIGNSTIQKDWKFDLQNTLW